MDDYFGNPLDPDTAAAIGQVMAEAAMWNKLDTPVRNWTQQDEGEQGFLFDSFIAEYADGTLPLKWAGSDGWGIHGIPNEKCECCGTVARAQDRAYQFVTVYVDLPDGRWIDVPFGHIGLN